MSQLLQNSSQYPKKTKNKKQGKFSHKPLPHYPKSMETRINENYRLCISSQN